MNEQVAVQQQYDLRILRSLRRITRAIALHSRQLAADSHVTGPQLICLRAVTEKGPLTATAISREIHVSPSTVVGILDRLEDRQLIERIRSQTDKRKIHPRLTATGNALLNKAPTALQDSFVRKFDQLQSWEQHMIIASLQRVAEMMDAEEIDASPFLDLGSLDRPVDKDQDEKD